MTCEGQSEASELRGEPPLALHPLGLMWNHLSGGQVRAEACLDTASLIAPCSRMNLEPLIVSSRPGLLLIQLVK